MVGPRSPPDDVDLVGMAAAFAPLANEKRLALLRYLVEPHYVEEIASHLGMARQAAQKHIDQLIEIGVIRRQVGRRASGPVTDFVIVPQALFALTEGFARLATFQTRSAEDLLLRTQRADGAPSAGERVSGPSLTVVRGLYIGTKFALTGRSVTTIGRDIDRDISLAYDPFVSNRHAEVLREGAEWRLVDAFSTNGTQHEWVALPRGGHVALRSGDVVGVGRSLLVFRDR